MDKITLKTIVGDHIITQSTDAAFLHAFQKAVLLALAESGALTEMECSYAEEQLEIQLH